MGFFTDEQMEKIKASRQLRASFLTQFDFLSETVRVWNGNTDLEAGGHMWTPLMGAGTIAGLGFSGGIESRKVTFGLPAIPDTENGIFEKALADSDETYSRLAKVFIQLFDQDWQNIGDPLGIDWGYMGRPVINRTPATEFDGGTRSITLDAENIFYGRPRSPAGRYTDRDQQARHTGDKGLSLVGTLANVGITFTYPGT